MKNLLLLSTMSISIFATTIPLHVELDLYQNKAFINKTFELTQNREITTKVPQDINIEDIRYTLEDGCLMDDGILEKITDQKRDQNKSEITYKIEALKAKTNLLKTISLKDIIDSEQIENMSTLLVDNLTKNMLEIDKLNKELKELNTQSKLDYKKLKLSFTCKDENAKLKVSYPLNSIRYTPFYNISADINNKSVTIEKQAVLLYKGAQNYDDIDLNIYSYRYNQNITPQHFYPKYLGQKKVIMYAKSVATMDSMQNLAIKNRDVSYQEIDTKSLYKIKDVSLKSEKKNLLRVDKSILDASFKTVIDAYGTNKAYMQATIKTKKDYSAAQANYFLNQNSIASKYMNKIQKETQTKLYFGEDEHIGIQKELIKTLDEKTFFGDKKISTQNWKYTITNKKPYSTDIEFITRVPISKNAEIKVKTLAQPKFNKQNAKGKTTWDFRLDANSKKEIIFGYEISNSK